MAELGHDRLEAWQAFLTAHARVVRRLTQELETETGLPLNWYDVLYQLSAAPDRELRMSDLARAVLLSASGLTRLVDRMQAAGLVRRTNCPGDGRAFLVELTEAGLTALRRAAPVHLRGIDEHFARLLQATEVDVLRAALWRIAAADGDSGTKSP